MSDSVIRVENLGKCYTLSHQQQGGYKALRDVLADGARSVGKRLLGRGDRLKPNEEDFWALKDVNFEIKQGDRVGIIGRNGAGKSTLLKILSRIVEPTTGEIGIRGRVASLLEVGTGFHPELTGRENIFLNGAILGMGKSEITRKFDEIVAFAEVEKFLDTPVKRYSSGMYVRLAFAVAAHLEPEILIVDEVLAVGDAQFQKKCLGKMEDVGKEGRTVIFVSHQMAAIENLCSTSIVLSKGQVHYLGDVRSGIQEYLDDSQRNLENTSVRDMRRSGNGDIVITDFSVENLSGKKLSSVFCGQDITLVFDYEAPSEKSLKNVNLGFSIHSNLGDMISVLYSEYSGVMFSDLPKEGKLKCTIRDFPYAAGRYSIGVRVLVNGIEADWPREMIGSIDVEGGDFYGTGYVPASGAGTVLVRGSWDSEHAKVLV
jgi:lipopolysaccharide transport system ATP-binding protein